MTQILSIRSANKEKVKEALQKRILTGHAKTEGEALAQLIEHVEAIDSLHGKTVVINEKFFQ